jgi:hypothetical protein
VSARARWRAERGGVIAREAEDVPRLVPGQLPDGVVDLARLAAPVVRVVLEEAVHLPRRHADLPQRGAELLRRHVRERDLERRGLFQADKLTGGAVMPFDTVTSDANDASDHAAVWAEFNI